MKHSLRFIIPLSLIVLGLITACAVPRSDGGAGDAPSITTPPAVVSPLPAQPSTATVVPSPPTEQPTTAPSPAGEQPTAAPSSAGGEALEAGPSAAVAPQAAVEPGKVLVKLSQQAAIQARGVELGADQVAATGISTLDQALRDINATALEPVVSEVARATPGESIESMAAQTGEMSQLYTVKFSPDQNPQEVAAKLAQSPEVQYAEPDYIAGITDLPARPVSAGANRGTMLTPNDPLFNYQWNMQLIQMPAAWDIATGQGVIVAVIDTGIDFGAPDLADTKHLPGYDFANSDADPTDDQSHGTHVAGTIAQSTNNGVGVAGVAYNASLLPVKVLGANGQGSYDNIIKGITYAVDQGAKVINMSLAGSSGSQALLDAVQYAYDHGVVVVAAAGNSGSSVQYPAAYDDYVIGVGSVRFDKTRPAYSNFGPEVDLMAPGGDNSVDQNSDGYADGVLQQTFKTAGTYTYLFFEGTSMATPHVAGLAALILSVNPDASPAEVENIMASTAQNLGSSNEMGAGLIQAASALASFAVPTSPTPIPTVTVPVVVPTTTFTPLPPTFTSTPTTAVPTATSTPLPPTATPLPPTPVVTPTLTPGPLPAGELLLNGSFETDEGWIFGDTPVRGAYDSAVKLSGNQAVRLGIISGPDRFSYSSVWQRVALPAEARQVTLRLNLFPVSQDQSGSGDAQNIMILSDRFQVIRTLSTGLSNSQAWEARTYDLSDLIGQTIYVYFGVVNTGRTGRLTAMYVDDVSLTWAK